MDAQIKEKWVKALRSGEYKQTRRTLRDDDGFCCLGVLCQVAGIPIDETGRHPVGTEGYDPIWDVIGVSKSPGDGYRAAHQLAPMNDIGISFAEIADFIERNL